MRARLSLLRLVLTRHLDEVLQGLIRDAVRDMTQHQINDTLSELADAVRS